MDTLEQRMKADENNFFKDLMRQNSATDLHSFLISEGMRIILKYSNVPIWDARRTEEYWKQKGYKRVWLVPLRFVPKQGKDIVEKTMNPYVVYAV